jgi:hypothetical protein
MLLQAPRARIANGWALGEFGGEFGQCMQTYAAPHGRDIFGNLSGSFNVAASLLLVCHDLERLDAILSRACPATFARWRRSVPTLVTS